MSNSSLITYKNLTTQMSKGRQSTKIDKIFVHHMAGNLSLATCAAVFRNNPASSHYGIDSKGKIGQFVLEENTAWHCGNWSYNLRSIAIELANDGGASTKWHVSDKAIASCIKLLVDICKRNKIKKLNYTGDLKGNLVMHCWTAATACPGPYLKTKFKYIAQEVNKQLTKFEPYLVKVSKGIPIYVSATSSSTAGTCPIGVYTIVEEQNNRLKLKSGVGWISAKSATKI